MAARPLDAVTTGPPVPVAVIGLGAMGAPMARRLLTAGHPVTVWNRTAARSRPLVEAGARVAADPAAAAGSAEIVITMLTGPEAVRAVVLGRGGVFAGIRPGGVLAEMSTIGPAATAELAGAAPPGAYLLDAPVLGSVGEAESGTLRIFVGGPAEPVRRCAEVFGVLGEVLHVGGPGAGAAAKLVANSVLFGVLGVLGEAVGLAGGLGLARGTAWEVLAATPLAAAAERRRPALESGEYPRRFALALARKDADLVLAAARGRGLELRLAAAARAWLADAEEAGYGGDDYTRVLELIAGRAAGPAG